MNYSKNLLKIIGGFILALASFAAVANAAGNGSLSFMAVPKSPAPGQEFTVIVTLDPGDNTANAFSGNITIASPVIAKKVLDGHSFTSLWIQNPSISSDGHSISFAGIVPGGISTPGELLRFIASAPSVGSGKISATDLEAYAQNASATPITIGAKPLSLNISGALSTSTVDLNDTVPPESFSVSISHDPNFANGAEFAAFTTHDKQSGVDHYEAAFSYLLSPSARDWQTVTSPYTIPGNGIGKLLWIKAVDGAGNEVIARAATPEYYRNLIILAIILLFLLCLALFLRRRFGSARSS